MDTGPSMNGCWFVYVCSWYNSRRRLSRGLWPIHPAHTGEGTLLVSGRRLRQSLCLTVILTSDACEKSPGDVPNTSRLRRTTTVDLRRDRPSRRATYSTVWKCSAKRPPWNHTASFCKDNTYNFVRAWEGSSDYKRK